MARCHRLLDYERSMQVGVARVPVHQGDVKVPVRVPRVRPHTVGVQGFARQRRRWWRRPARSLSSRFHGHNAENYEKPNISAAERFRYLYTEEELKGWVDPIRRLAEQADRVHVLMNNCYGDYGVRNARQLAELLATG